MNPTQQIESRPGYKMTKLGWMPLEWEVVNLSELVKRFDAGISVVCNNEPKADYEGPKVLKLSSVTNGYFEANEFKQPLIDEVKRLKVSVIKNRILVCRKNTPELVGSSVLTDDSYVDIYLPDLIWQSVPTEKEHSIIFLVYLLNSFRVKGNIKRLASGSSLSMVNITKYEFLKVYS